MNKLRIEEVALLVGCSVKSVNNWYWFKNLHPEHEYAKMLPEFTRDGPHGTRLWRREDMWKLIEFKQRLPKGRYGILGDITQKYYRKAKQNEQTKI
jgi:hypothetical protein